MPSAPTKLIETALPLDAINAAAAREKSIRHGHPSTLHLWWARRPLAAARAVLFAQLVDDPSTYTDELLADPPTRAAAEALVAQRAATGEHPAVTVAQCAAETERSRLFGIIERLVPWEATTNPAVLAEARAEILRCWRRTCARNAGHPRAAELFDPDRLPAFHDPFAGGGALPLEAQRLGLQAHASDLNPVAVLITKAMIELPPRFAGAPPVHPETRAEPALLSRSWRGAQGLAADVRSYGRWMREQAVQRIGHLYPAVPVTPALAGGRAELRPYAGQELTVIAWLWARTVASPNPAYAGVAVPLVSTFVLSSKAGKEAWVEPVVTGRDYRFTVRTGPPPDPEATKRGTKLARGANFRCLLSGTPISGEYIKAEGKAGRLGARLLAVVAEGARGRVYLDPTPEHEAAAWQARPAWAPDGEIVKDARAFTPHIYGMTQWAGLFTARQLVALGTFAELVGEARERVERDAVAAGLAADGIGLAAGGSGARAYAEAVSVYLAFALSKLAESHTTICTWSAAPKNELVVSTFRRQALPMTWDFAEANPLAASSGSADKSADAVARVVRMALPDGTPGSVAPANAASQHLTRNKIVSTDPPYYDNVPYADLSDFFYVWLRRSLREVYPDLFATVAVPKAEELVATPYRHGGKQAAERFFLEGMTQALRQLAAQVHPAYPLTIYYAFKQAETKGEQTATSTGWETFLDAVLRAGLMVTGTWPVRTERSGRMRDTGSNALASSIVLVCRPRDAAARAVSRREFVTALAAELPVALRTLQHANIAPVDLAQAAIGPGMKVFSRYPQVLDVAGQPVPVRAALALINQTLDEALAQQEGDFDADSRWALAWYEGHGFGEGAYGEAETLSKAKNTAVSGLVAAGVLRAGGGKVRLLAPEELAAAWDPATDGRLTAWESVHQLARALETGGEQAAAALVGRLGAVAETARALCYRLYVVSERKKRAAEALRYNALVQSWPDLLGLAAGQQRERDRATAQGRMDL